MKYCGGLAVLNLVVSYLLGASVAVPVVGAVMVVAVGGLAIAVAGLIGAYVGPGIVDPSERLEEAYRNAHRKINELVSHWDTYKIKMQAASTHIDNNVRVTLEK